MDKTEFEIENKKLLRKNRALKQALKQDSILRNKYDEALKELRYKDEQLTALNSSLENKVKHKTKSLKDALEHESRMKNILEMITDVNESLVGILNVDTIVKQSIKKICKVNEYKFCWLGFSTDDGLEIIYDSNNKNRIFFQDINLPKKYRKNKNSKNSNLFKSALQALETNKIVITALNDDEKHNIVKKENYVELKVSIHIPLIENNRTTSFAVLSIYSSKDDFNREEIALLENLASDISFAINISNHRNNMEKLENERISNYEETILAFVNMIEQRDSYTAGHTLRVAEYSSKIAKEMKIEYSQIKKLEKASILHDIGKIVTPDSILLKPNALTLLEYDLIKQHAVSGYKMLSQIAMYEDLAKIIKQHHERYDGSGYPDGLKGDEIDILAHIMGLADTFDAMTTNRIYKQKESVKSALNEIKTLSGTLFHPKVVDAALKVLKNIKMVATTQLPEDDLEHKRFSYFFSDNLTGVYNEKFLEFELINDSMSYTSVNMFLLKNFSEYNRKFSWEDGNNLLIKIAHLFSESFRDANIFRLHGDDFVILSSAHLDMDDDFFEKNSLFENETISFDHAYLDNATQHEIAKFIASFR